MRSDDKTRIEVGKQVARLTGKPFAPSDATAVAEIVNTLIDCCSDIVHVQRTVDELVRKPGDFPEPALFRVAARQVSTMVRKPDYQCEKCGGTGRIVHRFGGTPVKVRCFHDSLPCEICTGKGSFVTIRGGITGVEDCSCIQLRPKEYRAPWQPENYEEVPR